MSRSAWAVISAFVPRQPEWTGDNAFARVGHDHGHAIGGVNHKSHAGEGSDQPVDPFERSRVNRERVNEPDAGRMGLPGDDESLGLNAQIAGEFCAA